MSGLRGLGADLLTLDLLPKRFRLSCILRWSRSSIAPPTPGIESRPHSAPHRNVAGFAFEGFQVRYRSSVTDRENGSRLRNIFQCAGFEGWGGQESRWSLKIVLKLITRG